MSRGLGLCVIALALLAATKVTAESGCDEDACKVGTATAGGIFAIAGAAFGAISCPFTAGAGCALAAGALAAGGAAAAVGSEACGLCNDDQEVLVTKLDDILENQNIKFEEIIQNQEENVDKILENQNTNFDQIQRNQYNITKTLISNQLETNEWFRTLETSQKEILANHAVLKLSQKKIQNTLNTMINNQESMASNIDLGHIISLYGKDIQQLNNIARYFKMTTKNRFGGIINNYLADEFRDAALDTHRGVRASSQNVIKMLTSGHPLKQENLWESQSSFCDPKMENYLVQLLTNCQFIRSIALHMEGTAMLPEEVQRFINSINDVHHIFKQECLRLYKPTQSWEDFCSNEQCDRSQSQCDLSPIQHADCCMNIQEPWVISQNLSMSNVVIHCKPYDAPCIQTWPLSKYGPFPAIHLTHSSVLAADMRGLIELGPNSAMVIKNTAISQYSENPQMKNVESSKFIESSKFNTGTLYASFHVSVGAPPKPTGECTGVAGICIDIPWIITEDTVLAGNGVRMTCKTTTSCIEVAPHVHLIMTDTFARGTSSTRFIRLLSHAKVTLNNVTLSHFVFNTDGAGIYAPTNNTVNILNSDFKYNKGSAIFMKSGFLHISGSGFQGNEAVQYGGAIYVDNSEIELVNNRFTSNKARGAYGGGVYVLDCTKATFLHTVFTQNEVTTSGGGMHLESRDHVTLHNVTFIGNRAEYGAGLYVYFGTTVVTSSVFNSNVAGREGGAIYLQGGKVTLSASTPRNLFADNTAPQGSAISCYNGGEVNIAVPYLKRNKNKVYNDPRYNLCTINYI